MNRRLFLPLTMLLIAALLTKVQIGVAAEAEETMLSYDDGVPEGNVWPVEEGPMAVVYFDPPWSCQILEIYVYITGISGDPAVDSFHVYVYGVEEDEVVYDFLGSVADVEWMYWDVRDERVGVNGSFEIMLEWLNPLWPEIGTDYSDPDGYSFLVGVDGEVTRVETYDLMIRAKVRPLDADGDGLKVWEEEDLGTDPTKADTDGDGLDDKNEVDLNTDPTKVDTDGDGLDDKKEVDIGTDPKKTDTDGDGLNDGAEVNTYNSDPLKTDTDGDGLDDKREADLGTDLLKTDTDGDFWNDQLEASLSSILIFNPTSFLLPNGAIVGLVVIITVAIVITKKRRAAPPPPPPPPS